MKERIWKCMVLAVLIGLIVWMRVDTATQDERYRILIERQDRTDRLAERLPSMIESALERHRKHLYAYLEGNTDDRQEGD